MKATRFFPLAAIAIALIPATPASASGWTPSTPFDDPCAGMGHKAWTTGTGADVEGYVCYQADGPTPSPGGQYPICVVGWGIKDVPGWGPYSIINRMPNGERWQTLVLWPAGTSTVYWNDQIPRSLPPPSGYTCGTILPPNVACLEEKNALGQRLDAWECVLYVNFITVAW